MGDAPGQELISSGVIVVELDDVVPRRHPDLPNLYVATTPRSLEHRFAQIQRRKAPSRVRDHVIRLREDLSIDTRQIDRDEAKAQRRDLTSRLRAEGYTVSSVGYVVKGGH